MTMMTVDKNSKLKYLLYFVWLWCLITLVPFELNIAQWFKENQISIYEKFPFYVIYYLERTLHPLDWGIYIFVPSIVLSAISVFCVLACIPLTVFYLWKGKRSGLFSKKDYIIPIAGLVIIILLFARDFVFGVYIP